MASTLPLDAFIATTVGSLNTIPSPWRYTSVFAVPRSIARARPISGSGSPTSPPHHPPQDAAREVLLLPDRHVPLQLLDAEPAGLEGLGAVRRRARHHDGNVTESELAEPVEERHLAERPAFQQLHAALLH